jgi:dipeptide/tripeptide permease
VAPVLTGYLVDRTGRFDLAFALAAMVSVVGFIGWVWILPRIAPIDWSAVRGPTAAGTARRG